LETPIPQDPGLFPGVIHVDIILIIILVLEVFPSPVLLPFLQKKKKKCRRRRNAHLLFKLMGTSGSKILYNNCCSFTVAGEEAFF